MHAAGRVQGLEEVLRNTQARLDLLLRATGARIHELNVPGVGPMHSGVRPDAGDSEAAPPPGETFAWWHSIHPDDADRVRSELTAAFASSQSRLTTGYRLRDERGNVRFIEDHVEIQRNDRGLAVAAFGVAIDITDRQRIHERAIELQTLTAALSSALDPQGVGRAIIEHAMPALGANAGNVFLLDAQARTLANVALLGYEPDIAAWSQQLPVDGETLVAEVVRTGRPVLFQTWEERLKRFPHHRTVHALGGDRAVAGLPLHVEGRIIGALSLAFPTDRTFDDDDVRFMSTVADLCAQALERAQLYEAVRHGEMHFRQLADAMPQIAWAMAADGTTMEYLNQRWFAYTGQDARLGASAPVLHAIHPHDRDAVASQWQQAQEAGTPFRGELRLRGSDGHYRWFLTRSVPIRDAHGTVVRWLGTSTDIHEAKQSEERQRLLAEVGQALAESLDPTALLQQVTRILVPTLADYAFVDLMHPGGQLQRVSWAHVDPEEQRVFDERLPRYVPLRLNPEHPISRTLASGESQFIPHVAEDWLEQVAFSPEHLAFMRARRFRSQVTVPLRARNRTQGALTLCYTDASGRRYTPELLELAREVADRAALAVDNAQLYVASRDAELKVRRLLEAPLIGVIVADEERILEANDHFLEMLGYSREDLIAGRLRWPEMTPAEFAPLDRQALAELHAHGTAAPFEKAYFRRDGTPMPILIGVAALQTDPPQYICYILDLTERKRAEDEWRAFVDAAAHDLRNPLTAVIGQTQLMQRRLQRDGMISLADATPRLASIAASSGRAVRLIDDLMDTVRLRAGQPLDFRPAPLDLAALVADCADDAMRATASHLIRVDLGETPLVVNADAARLERVIRNILDNAIKYSPDGQAIDVRLRRDDDGQRLWAILTITDRGIGIPQADLPYVFERFRRGMNVAGRIAGSGIGLTGAQQIVNQHGGSLTARSTEGKGSTFSLRLPAHSQAKEAPDAPPA